MLHPKKQVKNIKFQEKQYEDGHSKEKLNIRLPKEVIEDISLKKRNPKLNEKKLYMEEFLVKNKNLISPINSRSLKRDIQKVPSFQISEVESILKDRDLEKFWTEFLTKQSERSWLPTQTDLVDLDLNYSNGYLSHMVQNLFQLKPEMKNLWNKSSQKTSYQSLQFFHPNTMENAITVNYCRKIRIYPNSQQKNLFEKCFGAHRHFYNKTISFITQKYETNSQHEIKWTLQYFRENNMKNKEHLKDGHWEKEIPNKTKEAAIQDAMVSYKTSLKLSKQKKIGGFRMNFKSKKFPTQIFKGDKKALNINRQIFVKILGKKSIRSRRKYNRWWKNNIKEIESNFVVKREFDGRYYLCLPMSRKSIKVYSPYNDVYLDPGTRTFQTFYSPDGVAGKLGDNFNKKLQVIGEKEDKLKGVISTINKKRTRQNLRKRCSKLRAKIKNKVNDLHWKCADYLCKNFNNIFLPTFETKKMSNKNNRKITSGTCRQMMMLSHFAFKEKLKFKAKTYGKNVINVSEAYTTKTCGCCGNINEKITSEKIFTCGECNYSLDRDFHGSRNLYLRTISFFQG